MQYQLVDFGAGRKLERFGAYLVDRPCPGTEANEPQNPSLWGTAHGRYERLNPSSGEWSPEGGLPESWTIDWGVDNRTALEGRSTRLVRLDLSGCAGTARVAGADSKPQRDGTRVGDSAGASKTQPQPPRRSTGIVRFELRAVPSGQVGIFPEQAENWQWIGAQAARVAQPLKVLNLFAYTGGSTLAAARAGAEVVHVDGARSVVAWARRNAELSGLAGAPIRWIVEDARKFVQREIRRGNAYNGLILDPPSYGHGPKRESWTIEEDLESLLRDCAALTADRLAFVLVTCHTSGIGAAELRAQLTKAFPGLEPTDILAGPLTLVTPDGRRLASGVVARWP